MILKVKDILPKRPVKLEYRTFGPDDENILAGYANWDGHEIKSEDGDDWYLDDDVLSYSWDGPDSLIIWYESTFITG